MRRFIVCAVLALSASAVRADGVPPTPLHDPPPVPVQMMPPPRALSPWETLIEPREPLPVSPYPPGSRPVPEPATAALLGVALVALGWRRMG